MSAVVLRHVRGQLKLVTASWRNFTMALMFPVMLVGAMLVMSVSLAIEELSMSWIPLSVAAASLMFCWMPVLGYFFPMNGEVLLPVGPAAERLVRALFRLMPMWLVFTVLHALWPSVFVLSGVMVLAWVGMLLLGIVGLAVPRKWLGRAALPVSGLLLAGGIAGAFLLPDVWQVVSVVLLAVGGKPLLTTGQRWRRSPARLQPRTGLAPAARLQDDFSRGLRRAIGLAVLNSALACGLIALSAAKPSPFTEGAMMGLPMFVAMAALYRPLNMTAIHPAGPGTAWGLLPLPLETVRRAVGRHVVLAAGSVAVCNALLGGAVMTLVDMPETIFTVGMYTVLPGVLALWAAPMLAGVKRSLWPVVIAFIGGSIAPGLMFFVLDRQPVPTLLFSLLLAALLLLAADRRVVTPRGRRAAA